MAGAVAHIGTAGWGYDFWIGNFYPAGAKPRDFLAEYSKRMLAVEVDSSYYGIPPQQMVKNWRSQVPEGFTFTAKMPRRITDEKMLRDAGDDVGAFLENIRFLGPKLGCLLVQLPPSFTPDHLPALKDFVRGLPPVARYAIEVKNRGWLGESLYKVLRDAGVALVLADHPWMPKVDVLTAGFTYIRWEGDKSAISGTTGAKERDRDSDTAEWAGRVRRYLEAGIEVYGVFTKYYSGHSPSDAQLMMRLLGMGAPPGAAAASATTASEVGPSQP